MERVPTAATLFALGRHGPIQIDDRERLQREIPSVEPVEELARHTAPAADRRLGQAAFPPHPIREVRDLYGARPGWPLFALQAAGETQPANRLREEGRDGGGPGRPPGAPRTRLPPPLGGDFQLLASDGTVLPHIQQKDERQLAARYCSKGRRAGSRPGQVSEITQAVSCEGSGAIALDHAGVSEKLFEHVRISFLREYEHA